MDFAHEQTGLILFLVSSQVSSRRGRAGRVEVAPAAAAVGH